MSRRALALSMILSGLISLIFLISASLDGYNRGIRFNEERMEGLRLAFNGAEKSGGGEGLYPRLDELGNRYALYSRDMDLIHTNLHQDTIDAMEGVLDGAGLSPGVHQMEIPYSEGEVAYLEGTRLNGGNYLVVYWEPETIWDYVGDYLPIFLMATVFGGLFIFGVHTHWSQRQKAQTLYLLHSIRKYVKNPEITLDMNAKFKEFEEPLRYETSIIKKDIDRLNSQLSALSDMIVNMEEGVILVGKDRKIININASAVKLVNASIHIHYQYKDLLYLCRDPKFIRSFTEAFQSAKASVKKVDLDDKILRIYFNPVFTEDNEFFGMMMLLIDDTQATMLERQRQEFTSNVTHELKTPLTSIRGYAELMSAQAMDSETQQRFAGIILEESGKLFDLIDAVISMSRVDEKNRIEEYILVDIRSMTEEIFSGNQQEIAKKQLSVNIDAPIPAKLYTHPTLIREVLSNLVDNAIAYNRQGGRIHVKIEDQKDSFTISIADTGIGISYDDQRRVFERFYMVDPARTINKQSTGLGLAIVKHNVESLRGTISLESQIREGSTFVLTFPKNGISFSQ
ncbi:MAG: ATP-binding protein [Tissierellia bacterium]|nr:ATP-binding protein [Tissierellia bacterium]